MRETRLRRPAFRPNSAPRQWLIVIKRKNFDCSRYHSRELPALKEFASFPPAIDDFVLGTANRLCCAAVCFDGEKFAVIA